MLPLTWSTLNVRVLMRVGSAGVRSQQRSGGLSQNYLPSYGSGLGASSTAQVGQTPYMSAAYSYGGSPSLSAPALNQPAAYSSTQQASQQVRAGYYCGGRGHLCPHPPH